MGIVYSIGTASTKIRTIYRRVSFKLEIQSIDISIFFILIKNRCVTDSSPSSPNR